MGVSALRTLLLADYLPANTRGVTIAAPAMWWPPKRQTDALDFSLDVTVAVETGDQIVQAAAIVSPSGGSVDLQIIDLTVSGAVITPWLASGAPDTAYAIGVAIRTVAGRALNWIVSVEVASETFEIGVPIQAPLPSQIAYSLIADTNGAGIVDTAGNALLCARAVWTWRYLSDTSGRTVTDTRGLPMLRAIPPL